MADPTPQLDDTQKIVERAIESVLEQVPELPDLAIPESASARQQPWADTAAPAGKNKRSLDEVLAEYAAQIAENPDAQVELPSEPPPAETFFERFSRPAPGTGKRRRRRSGRGRGPGGDIPAVQAPTSPGTARRPGDSGGPRRRSRRPSGQPQSGLGQAAPINPNAPPRGPNDPASARPPGTRRRRRSRGRRGGSSGAGGQGPAPQPPGPA